MDMDDSRSWVTVTESIAESASGSTTDELLTTLRRINRRRRWVVLKSMVAVDVHSMRRGSGSGSGPGPRQGNT